MLLYHIRKTLTRKTWKVHHKPALWLQLLSLACVITGYLTLVSSTASGIGRTWAHAFVHSQSLQPQKKQLRKPAPVPLTAGTVRVTDLLGE